MALLQTGLAKSLAEDYTIDQSLRFEDGDSPALQRTFSAGDRRTWTFSCWTKRGSLDTTNKTLFSAGTDANAQIRLRSGNQIYIESSTPGVDDRVLTLQTSAVYRDPSAWYHIVVTIDTTDGVEADRAKIYVNGDRVTDFETETTISTQDLEMEINQDIEHGVGIHQYNDSDFLDGYLAEVYFIDGQALDADSFGETDSTTNQWKPIDASDLTFGTNGFYLKFQDSAALGDDSSGNTNDFTTTNLVAADQMLDSPTNNFATFNSLVKPNVGLTYSHGNLKIVATGSWNGTVSTIGSATGKWYMEYLTGTSNSLIGVNGASNARWWDGNGNPQDDTTGTVLYYGYTGKKRVNNVDTTYGDSYANGDIIGIALNLDDSEITFYKNGTVQNSGTAISFPANLISQSLYTFGFSTYSATNYGNFGQDGTFAGQKTAQGNKDENDIGNFYYAVPAGYLTLCTSNLPDPSIALPGENYNTVLYSGNGVSGQTISGVGFQPDLAWIKTRTMANQSNTLVDALRGSASYRYDITSNSNAAEDAVSTDKVGVLNSDGFTLTGGSGQVNNASNTYVAWNWLAGGAPTVDNSAGAGNVPTAGSVKINGSNLGSALAGTIPATRISANTTAGFSICTYTGTGTAGDSFGHGLASAPEVVIVKRLDTTGDWQIGSNYIQASSDWTHVIELNLTGAAFDSDIRWNDTAASASVVTLGTTTSVNGSTNTYVAYCFHSVEGYSRTGSYTGNGNADGPFIFTGFRPTYVLIKQYNTTNNWYLQDGVRNPYNVVDKRLNPNLNDVEYSGTVISDYLSNGFKIRHTDGSQNTSNGSYFFLAFAENPFKTSNARQRHINSINKHGTTQENKKCGTLIQLDQ